MKLKSRVRTDVLRRVGDRVADENLVYDHVALRVLWPVHERVEGGLGRVLRGWMEGFVLRPGQVQALHEVFLRERVRLEEKVGRGT